MPLLELHQRPQPLSRFGVLGTCAEDPSRFVTHVGFNPEEHDSLAHGETLHAVHMRPPLETGGSMDVHVAAHIPLTNSEMKEMEVWMEEIADEYADAGVKGKKNWREQYFITPPWKDVHDNNTGVRRYRRYSCAGFVLDGHRQIDIQLLNLDALPEVGRDAIAAAYANEAGETPDLSQLIQFGLEGEGPWPLALPGYVIRALDRSSEEIRSAPYQAKEGDELMP